MPRIFSQPQLKPSLEVYLQESLVFCFFVCFSVKTELPLTSLFKMLIILIWIIIVLACSILQLVCGLPTPWKLLPSPNDAVGDWLVEFSYASRTCILSTVATIQGCSVMCSLE